MADDPSADPNALRARMGRGIARGIAWTSVANVVGNLLRIAVLLALGRMLAPDDFGLVAKANTILVLVKVVGDLGLGGALVQHQDPTRAHITTAYTVAIGLGAVLAVAVAVGAPWLAAAYASPGLAPVLRVIAVMIVLRGLGSVALQLCRRDMDFRTVAIADVVGYGIGAAASLAFAATGAGAWALVYGYLIESVIATAIVVRRHPPRGLGVDRRALRELLRYGTGETVTQVANMIATQGDYAVVGRALGDAPLGFYSRAYELVRFPANTFNSVVGSVLFPAMSRLQSDRVGLGEAYRRVLFATSLVLMPASAGMIVFAPELLRAALGNGWADAVVPFQIMAVGMLVRTNYKVGATVARARGDTYGVAMTQVVYAAVVIAGAALAVRWGITGVAVTTTGSMFVVFGVLTWLAMRHTGLAASAILRCHAWPALATVVVAVVSVGCAAVTRPRLPAPAVLGVGIAVAALAWLAVIALGARRRDADWTWAREVAGKVWRKLRRRKSPKPAAPVSGDEPGP